MDNVTKGIINQLRKNQYLTEDTKSGEKKIFQNDSKLVKGFITDVYDQIGNVHIDFDGLKYDSYSKEVNWGGNISGVRFMVIYSKNDSGVYYTCQNKKLTIDDTKALHKLNLYFDTTWFTAIREAILKNELDA